MANSGRRGSHVALVHPEARTLTDIDLKPLFDEARTEAAQAVPRVVSRS